MLHFLNRTSVSPGEDRMLEIRDRLVLIRRIVRHATGRQMSRNQMLDAVRALAVKAPELLKNAFQREQPAPSRLYPPAGFVPDPNNPAPDLDPWTTRPFAASLSARKIAFLEFCARRDAGTLFGETARAALGQGPSRLKQENADAYTRRLIDRFDCADFFAAHMLLALFIHDRHGFLSSRQKEQFDAALLGFKYWIDEPGACRMIYWSENHKILFHCLEYLAGQRFPDAVFTNNGMTGAQRMAHARPLILEWMDHRARWGYSEWCSNEYYSEDLAALVLLSEFAQDRSLARAAAMSADLLLLDTACDLFHGYHTGTHGRAYEFEIMTGRLCDMAPTCKVVWGLGTFGVEGTLAALALASARIYNPCELVVRIGQAVPDEFESHHRHGIPMGRIRAYGLDPGRLDHIVTLWAMGAYTEPETLDTLVRAADAWSLWRHPFISEFGPLNTLLPRDGSLGSLVKGLALESSRALLGEVNKTTYRTPDYALSSAQNYRPGEMGAQQHIWQATLSPDAIVFTTNPGSFGVWDHPDNPDNLEFHPGNTSFLKFTRDRLPNYWAGQNRLPRAAQYKNHAIILYNISMRRALFERGVHAFTHAFFPKWAFDEVRELGQWILGRAGRGYIALYSARPLKWQNPDDAFAHDAVAHGRTNAWLCRMGRYAVDGTFDDFESMIRNSEISVSLDQPGIRFTGSDGFRIEFSWTGPLRVNGRPAPISGFDRMNNPYALSAFDSGVYSVRMGEHAEEWNISQAISDCRKRAGE